MAGDTVGGHHEFAVGQCADCGCVGGANGLSVDQFMDALIWYRRRSGIECSKLCLFAGAH